MDPNSPQHEKLERLIHQTLRELPARRAPSTLESRVLAELERRAALPWWRKSAAGWPLAARIGLIVGLGGFVVVALTLIGRVTAGIEPAQFTAAFAPLLAWVDAGATLLNTGGRLLGTALRSIPPLWLYGGLAFVGAMYAALFGLSAAAYRTLYVTR